MDFLYTNQMFSQGALMSFSLELICGKRVYMKIIKIIYKY